jgi:F-type H+-transporting ATPase subunit b
MLLLLTAPSEGGGFNPFDPASGAGAFWTWVIFFAALIPMWKFVMGPVVHALVARDEQAQKAIAEAEKASEAADQARAEIEVKLGEARAEATKLLQEARARADARERELLEAAGQEARGLVDAARRTIEAEREKAVQAIRAEVVDLSLLAAGAVIKRNVGSADDKRLVQEMLGAARAAGGKSEHA